MCLPDWGDVLRSMVDKIEPGHLLAIQRGEAVAGPERDDVVSVVNTQIPCCKVRARS